MAALFQVYDEIYTASEFVSLDLSRFKVDSWEAGQSFVSSWLNQQQIFSQKTSGSTGTPKINKIGRSQIVSSIHRTARALGLPEGMQALVCLDLRYIGGKMMLARGLELKWHMHLAPPSVKAIERFSMGRSYDFCAMVPLQIEGLLKTRRGKELLNSIDKMIIGGAPLNKDTVTQLQSLTCQVFATYGMTETVSHVALQALNGPNKSDHFTMLPDIDHGLDERGCLRLRADVTGDQWIQTNDLVEFVSASEFRVLGRADHVINTGGVKVAIEALEQMIGGTGLLNGVNFAITKKSDPSMGQKIVLVLESSRSTDGLLEALKPLLPAYHCPKLLVTSETLPMTQSGKLNRQRLEQWVAGLPD